ncbi:MAG: aminotransferase class IV [Saprospiraceae bacterium]
MNQLNLNGVLQAADQPIFCADNRAFHYGDGLFETIRVFQGKIPFLKYHLERLTKGMQSLRLIQPALQNLDFVATEIYKLIGRSGNFRVRLTVFRNGAGLYTPTDLNASFLIEAQTLSTDNFVLNDHGLKIGLCDSVQLFPTATSSLKTCNALPYILAGLYKKEHQLDDCLLLNHQQRIAEASSANIFLVSEKEIWTPPLSEACLDGTCRKLILKIARNLNFAINEIPLSLSRMETVEEVWLSNAISGLRWVAQFKDQHYGKLIATTFVQSLQKLVIEADIK